MSDIHNSVCELSVQVETIRIVQLTDTHLKTHDGGKLLGLDTDYSLQAVVDLANKEYPKPDFVLGTGDLADSGAGDAYRRLIGYFDQVSPEHFWLPGNHDLRDVMIEVGGAERVPGEIRVGAWQIVMLDSQLPGEVGGHLGRPELQRLEECLNAGAEAQLHTLICLHHQPVPIGCEWLDEQMVSDADSFFEILGRYPRVRGLLWGHVHQELDKYREDLRLLCTPSTCVQFLPGQQDFAVDTQAPGYRWLELDADGAIRTDVSRAVSQIFPVDREASGYL
ncbi:3',5'-cyclic-AMP phosphodiesterase [Congregibacter variabilis]|uniref:3',5'-cyclic-AMP phosphodiesterase n=1 Tax=Congregibacter variabilis TaxID=3081200 RepID=A0ABZ0I353_9GAMM|nr:3',5'-cyclic-AMP phosphodiesterase [Congregibacter sp. IMCC43200]